MGAGIYNKPEPGRAGEVKVEAQAETQAERPRRIVRVVRRPRRSTWLYWLTAATSDLADSIERTNAYLEADRPAKAVEAFTDVFSLRRIAVLLPGGGVLRGARRPPAPIPSAMPSAQAPVPSTNSGNNYL